jgi:uncharacterized integral membrane protein (TIGR00698 family)
MGDTDFGIWAGTAINDTSSVVAAGTSWSNYTGNNAALTFATIVKLTRTLMIVPITVVLAVYTSAKSNTGNSFNFIRVFPWFVLLFMAAAILNTFLSIPREITSLMVQAGKFVIIMAMAAIGLNTNLNELFSNGIKPLLLGFLCWMTVSITAVLAIKILS